MAHDIIRDPVKNALIKDGWTITHDPFHIQYAEFDLEADLTAERSIAATKGTYKIVVEIKSFIGRSFVKDLQQAIGQYEMYLWLLQLQKLDYEVLIAISHLAYQRYFSQKAAQDLLAHSKTPLVVVDIEHEEVTQWINTIITKS